MFRFLSGKEITYATISSSVTEAEDYLRRFDSLGNPILPISGFDSIEMIRDLLLSVEAQMDEIKEKSDEISAFHDLVSRLRACTSMEQVIRLLDDHAEYY